MQCKLLLKEIAAPTSSVSLVRPCYCSEMAVRLFSDEILQKKNVFFCKDFGYPDVIKWAGTQAQYVILKSLLCQKLTLTLKSLQICIRLCVYVCMRYLILLIQNKHGLYERNAYFDCIKPPNNCFVHASKQYHGCCRLKL